MRKIFIFLYCIFASYYTYAEETDSIVRLATNYANSGKWDNAIEQAGVGYTMAKNNNSKSGSVALFCMMLAEYYSERGIGNDYMYAVEYANEALDIYNKGTREYLSCYHNLAYYYSLGGDESKADALSSEAIKMSDKFFETNRNDFAKEMKKYSDRYSNLGNYSLANKYAASYFHTMDALNDTCNVEYADKLYDIASYYDGERNYQEELVYLLKAEPKIKSLYSEQSAEYLHCIYRISLAYNLLRNMPEYENWEGKARHILVHLGIYEAVNVKETPLYSNTAKEFGNNGDFVNAIKNEEISLNIYAAHVDTVSMAKSFNTISNYYYRSGDLASAIEYCTYAVDIYNNKSISSIDCALAFNNMSVYMHDKKDDTSALSYAMKAKNMIENLPDSLKKDANTFLQNMYTNLSLYNISTGNKDEANKYAKLSTELNNSVGPKTKQNTVIGYYNEAMVAYTNKNVADLENAYHNAITLQTSIIKEEYDKKSASEKQDYWKDKSFVYDKYPALSYAYCNSERLITDTYNALLFKRQIELYGNTNAPTVEEISRNLKEGEMAIEFFCIDTKNVGKAYAALFIKAGTNTAKCVKLFVNKDLHNIEFYDNVDFFNLAATTDGRKSIFTDSRVGHRVWGNLLPFMEGVRKVYMTPCDLINSFAIEDLTCEDNYENNSKSLSQKYQFVRCTSTGQIATNSVKQIPVSGTPLITK